MRMYVMHNGDDMITANTEKICRKGDTHNQRKNIERERKKIRSILKSMWVQTQVKVI